MPNISSIATKLIADFSAIITFTSGDDFVWSPQEKTIYHPDIISQEDFWSLLHEVGHAKLNHQNFTHDIQLLSIEAEAWLYAQQNLAPRYVDEPIAEEYIQERLDHYRDWIHERSLCPHCQHTGMQTKANTYSCFNCRCLWRVNDARKKGLKRVRLTQQFL